MGFNSDFNLDEYEETVKLRSKQRKDAIVEIRNKIFKLREQMEGVGLDLDKELRDKSQFVELFRSLGNNNLEVLEEVEAVFRKVENKYSSDLVDKRIIKFLRAWPTQAAVDKLLEEHRVALKSF